MRFLEGAAPELPVQRVKPTVDGNDSLVVEKNHGGTRILRVFDFVEGPVWAGADPDANQLGQAGEMLGRIDVALAGFTHPADRRVLVWDVQHFQHLARLVAHTPNSAHRRLAQEVFRLFDRAVVPRLTDLETQVIHGGSVPHLNGEAGLGERHRTGEFTRCRLHQAAQPLRLDRGEVCQNQPPHPGLRRRAPGVRAGQVTVPGDVGLRQGRLSQQQVHPGGQLGQRRRGRSSAERTSPERT